MTQKTLIYISLGFIFFLGLVFYNYAQAQLSLKETRPSKLNLSLINPLQLAKVNTPVNFSWHIEAPPSFNAATTTIYWSYNSSGSALTKSDSPQAVAYSNFAPDYVSGRFALPSDFDLNLSFSKAGIIFYRAYAQVGSDYLWSPEQSLTIK